MWKLLWVAILVAVLSTYHADASSKEDKNAIKNKKRQTQYFEPPFFESLKIKRDDLNSIVIDPPKGYYYTTPEPEGYVYTRGYVYETPTNRLTTKTSTPGITYIVPYTPTTTRRTTTTTTTTTPRTTTTTTTTTPRTTTTTTTTPRTTTTPSTTTTTFKPTYLPPYVRYTYLPPETPRTTTTTRKPVTISYPPVTITKYPTIRTTYRPHPIGSTVSRPTLPPTTSRRPPILGYQYLPPDNKYLPFETRK